MSFENVCNSDTQRDIKGRRQRISTVGYKTIFRKINTEETFLSFTVITNKDYFSRNLLNLLSANCNIVCNHTAGKRKNEMFSLLQLLLIQPNTTQ